MGAPRIWRRDVVSWSLYDFANTIYSMNIVSLYLKRYIVEDLGMADAWFDIPFAISMALSAILAPALGLLSDYGTRKKLFLFLFTLTCCLATGLLQPAGAVGLLALAAIFIIANFAYEAGQPFYNALLYSVAEGRSARYVSGIGVALGYVGSVLGMILVMPFVDGSLFFVDLPGMDGWGKTAAFVPTAALFLLFAIPTFLFVRERTGLPGRPTLREAYVRVGRDVADARKYPGVVRFLVANLFFQDTVNTVILNIGIYCSLVLGFSNEKINLFLIISTLTAVAGSWVIGKIAQRWSLKKLMTAIAWGWIIALLAILVVRVEWGIWIIGSAVGIFLGGLWTVSRPMLAELVPDEELGKFFGLFGFVGRASAIIGPLIWTGTVALFAPGTPMGNGLAGLLGIPEAAMATTRYQVAVGVLAVIMAIGLLIFRNVPDPGRLRHAS